MPTFPATAASNTELTVREFLLTEALSFARTASSMLGVRRIALVGSILTVKVDPKDIDFLLTIGPECDLARLAAAGRRLKGRTQGRNRGADIFLADPDGQYIGRTCQWRECLPGIRLACKAQHCGVRPFLYDDLQVIRLPSDLIMNPPLELWPSTVRRSSFPQDVDTLLVRPFFEHCLAARSRDA